MGSIVGGLAGRPFGAMTSYVAAVFGLGLGMYLARRFMRSFFD